MKNTIKVLFALFIVVGFSSCLKDNSYEPYDAQAMLEKEAPILKEYVETTEGLEGAILHETGIWYKIVQEGLQPEEKGYYNYVVNSDGNFTEHIIFIANYEGKLVSNGVEFDKAEEFKNSVFGVIEGWKIGFLPKNVVNDEGKVFEIGGITERGLQQGSKIRLIIPSPYAYGPKAQGKVPANSPLDFTIEVLKVERPTSTQ